MCTECRTYPHDSSCPYAPEPLYCCPVCGEELDGSDTIYRNNESEIIGCECCVNRGKAALWIEEAQ